MVARILAAFLLIPSLPSSSASACGAVGPSGKPVVNADQTVILIWDAATKTQHFIRQASFKSEADDFGFLVPTPSLPELEESGNDAFPFLLKLTEPDKRKVSRPSGGFGCGCGGASNPVTATTAAVEVVAEKLVAGFQAVVLKADSVDALVGWLKDHGYAYSPEIEAWAKLYVEAGWKFTTLKVAKDNHGDETNVAASALRISFQTDRPLFPYREPDSRGSAEGLGARHRLLRIYFLGEARYQGELTQEIAWTGKVAWANKLSAEDRSKTLELLKLPESTGPADFWLTEFEDNWPYRVAPADLYFARDANQGNVERDPIIEYASSSSPVDVMAYTLAFAVVLTPWLRRFRRGNCAA
ncbi:MAG: DUF2330 domain-containing protein [Planctomycetia bacterium]|nr:DUF2330 domain-containing protein [Planctomycetia bacterium]